MINFDENTEVFENAILNYIVKVDDDYELYDVENEVIDRFKVIHNLSGKFFDNPEREIVFDAIKKYTTEYGKIPTVNEIFSVIKTKNYDFEEENILTMFSLNLHRYKSDFLYEYMKTFILKGNLNRTVDGIMGELKMKKITPKNIEETIDEVKNRFNEELNIDLTGRKKGFDIMDPVAHIQMIKKNDSTGFPYFDKVLGGGWEPGTLIVFEGPPKVGKSLVLGNIAVRGLFNKLNVGLYSVELSAAKYMKRLGSNAFNIPYTAYKGFTDEQSISMVADAIKKTAGENELGRLIVEDGPTGAMTSLDVENFFLSKEKELDMKFDLIIIDYINLLKYYKGEANMYEKIKSISEELRKIAKRNNWCILSATQVKAAYFNADDLFLDSTAESSGLVATVDSLFGLIGNSADQRIKIKNIANRDEGHMNSYKYFRKSKKYYRIIEDWSTDSEFWPDEDMDSLETAMDQEYNNLGIAASALGNVNANLSVDSSMSQIINDSYKKNTMANSKTEKIATMPQATDIEDYKIDPEILEKIHVKQNEEHSLNTLVKTEYGPSDEYTELLKKVEL